MKINLCAISDVGIERTNNEDVVAICPDLSKPEWDSFSTGGYITLSSFGTIAIVADGMGGANAGEIASSLVVKKIESLFKSKICEEIIESEANMYAFLKDCFARSNQAIMDYVVGSPDSIGLGTTIVLLWIVKGKAFIAWCGDSRCYCFNPDTGLSMLTKDHSLVQELVDKGEIRTEKDAFNHPDSNIITRCLGDVDAESEPDILTYRINDGDIFLLCSDGLCGYCRDALIRKVMYSHYERITECRDALLRIALKSGGHDNISILLCATLPDNYETRKVGLKGRLKQFFYRL